MRTPMVRTVLLTGCLLCAPATRADGPITPEEVSAYDQKQGKRAPAAALQQPDEAPPEPEPAPAPEPAPTAAPTVYPERHFALGFSAVKENGLAALGLRGRFGYVGLDAAVGYQPVLFWVMGTCNDIQWHSALQVTGALLIFFQDEQRRFHNGLRLGGVWSSLLGWGGLIGWQAELTLSRWWSLSFGAGFLVFPEAWEWGRDRVEATCGVRKDPDILATALQPYLGVGVQFYLF